MDFGSRENIFILDVAKIMTCSNVITFNMTKKDIFMLNLKMINVFIVPKMSITCSSA